MKKITINEEGIWIPTSEPPPFGGVDKGDYREISGRGFEKRYTNNMFTRFYFKFFDELRYTSSILGLISPMATVILVGVTTNILEIIYMPIALFLFTFQLLFIKD